MDKANDADLRRVDKRFYHVAVNEFGDVVESGSLDFKRQKYKTAEDIKREQEAGTYDPAEDVEDPTRYGTERPSAWSGG